jgi:phosphatidate cytidylyltransferase
VLKTRIITALLLLPLALAAIFLLPAEWFRLLAGVLLLIGTWEFSRLAGLKLLPGGLLLLLAQGLIMAGMLMSWNRWTASPVPPAFMACFAWMFMFLQMGTYAPGRAITPGYKALGTSNALLAITTAWGALSWLRLEPGGEWWILLLLLTIWASDVGAYFSGRAIGGAKLAPRISPGKTRAGFIGGVICAAAVAVAAGLAMPEIDASLAQLAILGATTAVVSVGGDLFISMHKRIVGLKDSGRLFPGHGGVLDRLDSLLAGAPFFVLAKLLMGI